MVKPEYHIPSMKDINNIKWNGFNVISTFSGCGGSSLGYKMAGFKVLWANEFIPSAQEVYSLNHPETILNPLDIRTLEPREILKTLNIKKYALDLFDGSPPCSSFSTVGKGSQYWGQSKKYSSTVQRTDDLFFEYARIVEGIMPKIFVAENVSGLVRGKARGYFIDIIKKLKSIGYNVSCKVLDAQWLGVPQIRNRTIFIGVRDDFKISPVYPKPFPYRYSVNDALPNLKSKNQSYVIEPESISFIAPPCYANEWEKLKIGESSEKYYQFQKINPYKPISAICATNARAASQVHPYYKRKFAIAELKRLSGFPEDFKLTGTYSQQWERIGRAVPPLMMYQVADTIKRDMLDCI